MKFLFLFLVMLNGGPGWLTDFQKAKEEAGVGHKLILLSFSGSDWCIPCIRLHHDIFESAAFTNFADSNLVLVQADFPRLKKNKLPAAQVKQNESLADTYNAKGSFPLTLLLDAGGKVIRQWEGVPDKSAEQFVQEINNVVHAGK